MRRKSVAILDIRSLEITAVVGERGVNNTFIIKSKYSCTYDGYAEGEMVDEESFLSAVESVVKSTISAFGGIKTFYVGVPAEFTKIVQSDKIMSFQSAKKITSDDCEYLAGMSMPEDSKDYRTVRHSCMYYVLSDKRKIIDPVGTVSDSLRGKFCFYQCSSKFINSVSNAFKKITSVTDIKLIPSVYAEAVYLIPPEQRDECAVLFDLGYISSSYSVIHGNGIAFCESFSVGIGHLAVYLMTELDIPFDVASAFLNQLNLNAKETLGGFIECVYEGHNYKFSTIVLRDKVREGLDGICETIEECIQSFKGKNFENKPMYITGESVKIIRGTVEHLSNRLVKNIEVIAPAVPYYDKPQFSSLLSLLDTALTDAGSRSFNK